MIATVMRVKNEGRYLRYALASLEALCGPIYLLDDGSTDDTPEIAQEVGVYYRRQDGLVMDEGRDRTLLYRWAMDLEPDWVFTLDGDEVLVHADRMLAAVERCADEINVFGMWLAVMASAPEGPHRWYGPLRPEGAWQMDRLFRVRDAKLAHEFKSNFSSNLHCGCVPAMRNRKRELLNAWIRYYGYETPQAVERKREFYSMHDPVNFPRVADLWDRRRALRPIPWNDGTDCREIGIHNTVIY